MLLLVIGLLLLALAGHYTPNAPKQVKGVYRDSKTGRYTNKPKYFYSEINSYKI